MGKAKTGRGVSVRNAAGLAARRARGSTAAGAEYGVGERRRRTVEAGRLGPACRVFPWRDVKTARPKASSGRGCLGWCHYCARVGRPSGVGMHMEKERGGKAAGWAGELVWAAGLKRVVPFSLPFPNLFYFCFSFSMYYI